jgi:hypothetical protein
MQAEMLRLEPPAEAEREWLLDGLSTLIRRHGFQPLVTSRILLPTREDFPDEVPEGPEGVRVLLLRLLWHAGMGEHRARLTVYEEKTFTEVDLRGIGHGGPGTAAWFAGIHGKVCEFGVNRGELRLDREELIGTLGHEVAHAFRDHHQLVVHDSEVEERLTDLTSVYLGFGVFLLNSSASFKTGGFSPSGEPLLFEKRERGYLSPAQIAFLLAAQAMARGASDEQRRALANALTPNHRKLFDDSCELLAEPARVRERLGVPEKAAWPTLVARTPHPHDLQLETAADGDEAEAEDENEEAEEDEPAAREPDEVIAWDPPGPPVYRIERNYAGLLGIAGGVLPLAVGAIGFGDGWQLLGSSCLGSALGYLGGRAIHSDACSECRAPLPRKAQRCSRCRGTVQSGPPPPPFADDEDDHEARLSE